MFNQYLAGVNVPINGAQAAVQSQSLLHLGRRDEALPRGQLHDGALLGLADGAWTRLRRPVPDVPLVVVPGAPEPYRAEIPSDRSSGSSITITLHHQPDGQASIFGRRPPSSVHCRRWCNAPFRLTLGTAVTAQRLL